MPKVTFTEKINEYFPGGTLVMPNWTAKRGITRYITDQERSMLDRDYPELVVPARGGPATDAALALAEGEGAEAKAGEAETTDGEDGESDDPLKGKAKDKRLRKGRRK